MSNRPNRGTGRRGHHRNAAWSPYNFIPLPDTVIPAAELPGHHFYDPDRHTGYFDVQLTTETPLFIRGMLTPQQKLDNKEAKDSPDFFTVDGQTPIIPGSSLRGMLRNIVEIITFSKLHFVSNRQKMFYRAVAADREDPLKTPYADTIGKFGRNIRAGYLQWDGNNWVIQPAARFGRDAYGKVADKPEVVSGVNGLLPFNDPHYKVQWHEVTYKEQRGRVHAVQTPAQDEPPTAVLVCTGNMLETGGADKSPRRKYALVREPDHQQSPLAVPRSVVEDYIDGLSPFQQEPPFDEHRGLLGAGKTRFGTPVFYIEQNGVVMGFGHTPNFRIAPLIWEGTMPRAVNPGDMVPAALKDSNVIDFAEALFGFVNEDNSFSYASRISVTSARLIPGQQDVLHHEALTRTPGSPKPSTFQHYLEQPEGVETPKAELHHFGTRRAKIRGHKLYWRQKVDFERLQAGNSDGSKSKIETTFKPVKTGVTFTFRVYFENLTGEELGALAWALTLGDEPAARHMLGMGKPYGLGVIKLACDLYLSNRTDRYTRLFDSNGWAAGIDSEPVPTASYVEAFKHLVKEHTGLEFSQHPRIVELLTMLQLQAPSRKFTYMSIKNENNDNEFKDRLVLPRPTEVVSER